MSWKAIPDTRPRDSETSVIECVVCAWNNTRSVGRRAQVTSRPFRDKMYVVRQVRRCMTRQRREDKTCQFEVNSTLDWIVRWIVHYMHNPSQNGNYKLKRNCLVSKWGINTLYSYLHIYKAVNKADANSAICSSLIATTSKFQDFLGTNSFFHALENSEKNSRTFQEARETWKKRNGQEVTLQ